MTRNQFCWTELCTDDPAAAKAFYGKLFDWSLEDKECNMGPFIELKAGEGQCGGIMGKDGGDCPTAWMPYVEVADLDASLAQVAELGGEVVVPACALEEGRFAVLRDPQGARIGIFQCTAVPSAG